MPSRSVTYVDIDEQHKDQTWIFVSLTKTLDDDAAEEGAVTEDLQPEEEPSFPLETEEAVDDICSLEKDPGPCKGYSQRWYYDKSAESCSQVQAMD